MRIDRVKNVFICDDIEYPPTRHNAEVYKRFLLTKDDKLKKQLSLVVLDI